MSRRESPNGTLDRLLAAAGSRYRAKDASALIAGVAAAPPGHDPDAWMGLVAPQVDDELRAVLRKRLRAARSRRRPPRPAPAARLDALRKRLAGAGLDGFVVPHSDEHQGEYVAARAERLEWLTGFTGSAGSAIVLGGRAAIFIDGRYTVQVRNEVDDSLFCIRHVIRQPVADWLAQHLPEGGRLGYDPWLHTPQQVAALAAACERAGGTLKAVSRNPIDAIWRGQPPPPIAPITPFDVRFAGKPSADKRHTVAEELTNARQDAAVLAAPDSIAWLLNIRGGDVPYAPLPLAFAVVHAEGSVDLFLDPRKLAPGIEVHLGNRTRVAGMADLGAALDGLGAERKTVRIDPAATPDWVVRRLHRARARTVDGPDPCAQPKATKNDVELRGIRAAHRRDGAAVTRFLAWLAKEVPSRRVTEITAADRLEMFRQENEHFRGLSFPTISGTGSHGAIVHYRSSLSTDRRLEPQSLYLVDSGAQYLDGTTDITRTVAVGKPTAEMRNRFTLVLKGHIAIATARFPRGTTGPQLDTLARMALWNAGLDFDHGTGHGVGHYLGVHEGPQRISKLPNRVPLEPGMVVSNEPGYYKPGSYGIRIENLVAVVPAPSPEHADHELYGFETLTLAPIDLNLVDPAMLSPAERKWLDSYHRRVCSKLTPMVDAETAHWLADATRPLAN